jgi:hypothetical protein
MLLTNVNRLFTTNCYEYDNICYMEFLLEWLASELKRKKWTNADLERAGGPKAEMTSMMFSGQRDAGLKTLREIAKAFGIPLKVVIGHLEPNELDIDSITEEYMYRFNQLSKIEREDRLAELEGLIEKRRERANERLSGDPRETDA